MMIFEGFCDAMRHQAAIYYNTGYDRIQVPFHETGH